MVKHLKYFMWRVIGVPLWKGCTSCVYYMSATEISTCMLPESCKRWSKWKDVKTYEIEMEEKRMQNRIVNKSW